MRFELILGFIHFLLNTFCYRLEQRQVFDKNWEFFASQSVEREVMNHVFVVLEGLCLDGCCGEFFKCGFVLVLSEDFH